MKLQETGTTNSHGYGLLYGTSGHVRCKCYNALQGREAQNKIIRKDVQWTTRIIAFL